MFQYILKRLLLMAVTLVGIALITFFVTRLTPGEPQPMAAQAASRVQGGYDDVVEQNRRNLGLDKPLVLNLKFEDRVTAAGQALRDYLRPGIFWRESAERSLRYSSTIAVRPALELLEELTDLQGPVDHTLKPTTDPLRRIDVEESQQRILELLPTLAKANPITPGTTGIDAQVEQWKQWLSENEPKFEEGAVEAAVQRYLRGETGLTTVTELGGFAVPALMDAVDSKDLDVGARANTALSGLTGLDFSIGGEGEWAADRDRVVGAWKSFHRRNEVRFADYGPVGDFVNIFRNTQLGVWMTQILTLDFGQSYTYRRPVNQLILDRLPITIRLSLLSIFFSYLIAVPLGIFSAVRRYTPEDRISTLIVFILYSLPSFWVAQMLLLTLTGGPSPFGFDWPNLFPTRGLSSPEYDWRKAFEDPRVFLDHVWHLVLPVTVLTYGSLAFLSRQMRSSMLEALNQDYIRTAYSKGLSGRVVVYKHALRNSLIPIITISSGLLPELIAGSIIIEQIFTIPGMGQLAFEAVINRDYPLINAILFYSAFLTVLGILLADLAYAVVDPRITYS